MAKVLLEPISFRDNATRRRAYIFCPACYEQSKINNPGEGAWDFNGDYDNPTFSPSLLVNRWDSGVCHSYIRDGHIQYLGDCAHTMADKTVELLDTQLYLSQHPNFGKENN